MSRLLMLVSLAIGLAVTGLGLYLMFFGTIIHHSPCFGESPPCVSATTSDYTVNSIGVFITVFGVVVSGASLSLRNVKTRHSGGASESGA